MLLKNKSEKERGITLVALVITIIILLILVGISIAQLTGSGLFEKAREAEEESKKAQEFENTILGDYENTINGYLTENALLTPEIKKAQSNDMLTKTTNTTLQDAYGNQIVVPAGFKITNDALTANKGIVIIDANENEFVWIPIPIEGKVYTNIEKTQFKTVELNRYSFDTNAIKTAQNDAVIETYFQELATSDKGNTTAKSISAFKTSVATNKGYYIGRYEARTGTARSAAENPLTPITLKASDYVYNYVTQPQAAERCKNMYDSSKPFTSDLMNSYAWDTATLFLQECGTNSKYSRQDSINTSIAPTGTNNQSTKDVQCNIYDFASNLREWTTETSGFSGIPYTDRGGIYNNYGFYTSYRSGYSTSDGINGHIAFRPILFL